MTKALVGEPFELDRTTYDALVAHARSDTPYEVCGLLGLGAPGGTRHYEIPNADRSMTYYVMESRALLRAMREIEDEEWGLGIYHSHTHTEAFPSPTDVDLAVYPEAVYLIVSLQEPEQSVIRAFDIADRRVTERVLTVDGEDAPVGRR